MSERKLLKCNSCGKMREAGRTRCRACLDKVKASVARKVAERKEKGLCARCDRVRDPTSATYCKIHLEYMRKLSGDVKAWVPGGRGRPPKYAKPKKRSSTI